MLFQSNLNVRFSPLGDVYTIELIHYLLNGQNYGHVNFDPFLIGEIQGSQSYSESFR
ncbi:protein of unknown function [Vibrio tapetis subsp. tapetis]|uniref:Uncharacterized protein n=1 Tax=Vibrio tapetis subsp. tapetis TaxID=1671868 RepID=A0A2N8ZBP9_9VIBR|nr:protein of unknown function [Vibrio tapetis subsp. tapetis]